jgi:hypothetical protein
LIAITFLIDLLKFSDESNESEEKKKALEYLADAQKKHEEYI